MGSQPGPSLDGVPQDLLSLLLRILKGGLRAAWWNCPDFLVMVWNLRRVHISTQGRQGTDTLAASPQIHKAERWQGSVELKVRLLSAYAWDAMGQHWAPGKEGRCSNHLKNPS